MISTLVKLEKIFAMVEDALVIGASVSVVFSILLNVIMRNIFHFPLSWPDELGRILFIFVVYLGYCIAIREDRELKINLISTFQPKRRAKVTIALSLVGLVFSALLILLGFRYMEQKRAMATATTILGIPDWTLVLVYLITGGVLIGMRYMLRLIRVAFPKTKGLEEIAQKADGASLDQA